MAMLGLNPMQERFRLAAYYLTDLAFQASAAEPLVWGVHGAVHRHVPPLTATPPGRRSDGLRATHTIVS
jgi:hypothetical protein